MKLDCRATNGAVGFVLKSARNRRRLAKTAIELFIKAKTSNNLQLITFKEAGK
ncbi:MAG: hypothetical protein AB7V50_08895 [Vampirovibrionia bacterium]